MNAGRERGPGLLIRLIALLAMVMTMALGLVGCAGSPEDMEFPLGEEPPAEPDMLPGGLTAVGGGSQPGGQPGGQENGSSSTTAGVPLKMLVSVSMTLSPSSETALPTLS